MDRDSTTRTGAKDPWGREGRPPAQRHVEASTVLDTEPGLLVWRKRAKGRSKLRGSDRMPGAGLRLRACRKALSDMLALKPYWGKPAVRNFRGGDGNVGIIRSPVRAIALLDRRSAATEAGRRSISPHCVTSYVPPTGEPFESEFHDAKGANSALTIPMLLFGIDTTEMQRNVMTALHASWVDCQQSVLGGGRQKFRGIKKPFAALKRPAYPT